MKGRCSRSSTCITIFSWVEIKGDGSKALGHQQHGISYAIIAAAMDGDVPLHMKEARLQALGGQALRVHLYIAHHSMKLTAGRIKGLSVKIGKGQVGAWGVGPELKALAISIYLAPP